MPRHKPPPKKMPGQGCGPRRINGVAMDVHVTAGWLGFTEKTLWSKVARGTIPYRKMNGRIIFLRDEIEAWLTHLDGCGLEEALANLQARHSR